MTKRFSSSADRNKQPILEQLKVFFADSTHVAEIGSGTGQHAIYFAQQLTHLRWQTSDLAENHPSINAWIDDLAKIENTTVQIARPLCFEIGSDPWPFSNVDAVYTANTTHIMQPQQAEQMMQVVAQNLPTSGTFCQYGPFKVNGEYTTESNRAFSKSLLERGFGGVRDISELQSWGQGLELVEKIEMPANNFLLIWRRL